MAVAQKLGLGEYCGFSVQRRQAHGFVITENRFEPSLRIGLHEHTHTHFTLVLEGDFTEQYEECELECRPGSMLIVPASRPHTDRMGAEGAHTLGIELSPKLERRVDDATGLLKEPRVIQDRAIHQRTQRLYDEFHSFDSGSLLALESLAMELLVLATRISLRPEAGVPAWMTTVVEMLNDGFREDISLSTLAEEAGVHEAHLARVFRRTHGCTVGEYARYLRLEETKRLLSSPKPLSEVAIEVGFYDQAHFSRAFKSAFGVSPSAYRRSRG